MKQNRIIAILTCAGLSLSTAATVLAAKDAAPVHALSLTTSAPLATTVTLAPQSTCDLCGTDIPEGEGIRDEQERFVCTACYTTTAPVTYTEATMTTTVVTTYNPPQSTVAFTTNMYTAEDGVLTYEYYAYVGETIQLDAAYVDLYYIETNGGCCIYEDGIITALQPGEYCLEVCTTEMFTGIIARYNVRVVQMPGVTEPEQTTTLMSCTTSPFATVTTSPYYPEYNPWVTDADGNQYYAGTNAYRETILQIMEYPQTTFAMGEAFNTDGLKVYMIEYRNYNQRDYDVSEVLNIETDIDWNTPGQYTVYISTDYTCGEAGTDAVLTYQVTVTDEYIYTTAVTDMTTTLPTTYTTTTTTATVPSGLTCTSTSTTTTTTVTTITTNPNETVDENGISIVKGDLNGDTLLQIGDVILLNRYIAEDLAAGSATFCPQNADFNNDGDVNTDDSTALLRCLAGL